MASVKFTQVDETKFPKIHIFFQLTEMNCTVNLNAKFVVILHARRMYVKQKKCNM